MEYLPLTIKQTEALYALIKNTTDSKVVMKSKDVRSLLPNITGLNVKEQKYMYDLAKGFGVACERQLGNGAARVTLQYGTGKFFNAGGAHTDPASQANTPDGELNSIHEQMFEMLKRLGKNFTVVDAMKVINSTDSVFVAVGHPQFHFHVRLLNHWATSIVTSKPFRGKDARTGLNLQERLRQWHFESEVASAPTFASTSHAQLASAQTQDLHVILADRERRQLYGTRFQRYDAVLRQPFPAGARMINNLEDLPLIEIETLKDHIRDVVWKGRSPSAEGLRAMLWDRCLVAMGSEAHAILQSSALLFLEGREGRIVEKYGVAKQKGSTAGAASSKAGKRKATVDVEDSDLNAQEEKEDRELSNKAKRLQTRARGTAAVPQVAEKLARSTGRAKLRKIMEATIGDRPQTFAPFPTDTHPALAAHDCYAHFERFNIRSPEALYAEFAPEPVQALALPGITTYRQLLDFVEYYHGMLNNGGNGADPGAAHLTSWVASDFDNREPECLEEAIALINDLKASYDKRASTEGCSHPRCFLQASNSFTPSKGGPNPYNPNQVLCLTHVQEALFVMKQLGIASWQGYLEETEECNANSQPPRSQAFVFSVESYASSFKGCDGLCEEDVCIGPGYRRVVWSKGEAKEHCGVGWGYCYTCVMQDARWAQKQVTEAIQTKDSTVIQPWLSHDTAVKSVLCANPSGRRDCARFAPHQTPRRNGAPNRMDYYGHLAEGRWLCSVCAGGYGTLVPYEHANYAPMRNRIHQALEDHKVLQKAAKLPKVDIYAFLHSLSLELMQGYFVTVGAMIRTMPDLDDLAREHAHEDDGLAGISSLT